MNITTGDIVDGRYEIVQIRRRSAAGVLADARHCQLEQPFTIKVAGSGASDAAVARLQREGRMSSLVQHDHAIFVTDVGRCERFGQYLVTERHRGEQLSELLEREGPLPVDDVMRVTIDAANAISAAHAVGIVHSGPTPERLLVETDGESGWSCKVTGFGLQPIVNTGSDSYAAYRAPELRLGATPTKASDQFALGVMVYEMLTGRVPELVGLDADVPTAPSGFRDRVPAELDSVVLRAVARSPAERFQSVDAFLSALLAAARRPLAPRTDPWDEASPPTSTSGLFETPDTGLAGPSDPVSLIIEIGETQAGPSAGKHLDLSFQTHERLRREYRRNIVAGGLFVPTDCPLELHDRVELDVRLDDEEPVRVEAEVVNLQSGQSGSPDGVGLSLGDDAIDTLGRYVRQHAGIDLEPEDVLRARVDLRDAESLTRAGSYLMSRLDGSRTLAELRREAAGLPFELGRELAVLIERGYIEVETFDEETVVDEVGLATEAPTEARLDGGWGAGAVVDFDASAPWEEPTGLGLDESSRIHYTDHEVERVIALVDYRVRRQNYLAAIRTLQKAIVVSPSVAEFYHRLAKLHMQFTGDTDEAERALQDAVQIAPDDPQIRATFDKLKKSGGGS